MSYGDKLAKLRKDNNYTQEQLAELLDVSRQAISKWESGVAYPETEKLIKLAELYNCSIDFLINDETEEEVKPQENKDSEKPARNGFLNFCFERKSKKTVRGVPLWHINIGFGRTANGIIAIGFCARGVVSIGLFSVGLLSLGLFSIGLMSIGVFSLGPAAAGSIALGLVSAGAVSVGIIAVGAVSVGVFSLGAAAVGQVSAGALAVGKYFALGDHAHALIAIGETKALGEIFQTDAVTAANYNEIIALLYDNIPKSLHWCIELVKPLM